MACIYIPTGVIGTIKVVLILFMFSCISFMVTAYFSRQQIIDNWSEYKCNPLIMTSAGLFGHNATQTLQECLGMQHLALASRTLSPMTNVMDSMSNALESANGIIGDMDFVSTNMTGMFGSGFGKIMGQLGNVGSAIQYLIIKIETLLQRLIATIAVIMYSMQSLLQGVLAIKRDTGLQDLVQRIINFSHGNFS
jgi:hypothetical protein